MKYSFLVLFLILASTLWPNTSLANDIYLIAQQKLTPSLDSLDTSSVKPSNKISGESGHSNQDNVKSDYDEGSNNSSNTGDVNNANNNANGINIKVKLSPDDEQKIKTYLRKGINFSGQGNLKLAKANFHKVLLIDPTNTDAYYNLGVIAEQENKLDEALKNYNLVLKYNPNDSSTADAVRDIKNRLAIDSNNSDTGLNSAKNSDTGNNNTTTNANSNDSNRFAFDNNQNAQSFQPSKPIKSGPFGTKNARNAQTVRTIGYALGRISRVALRYGIMFAIYR